jgi:BolA protein
MERLNKINALLKDNFKLEYVDVVNESHMHSVPANSETHFKVTIVSEDFQGKSKVARHQLVYGLLGFLMQEGLHALALHTYLPAEWQSLHEKAPDSPNCMGGSKST